MQYLSEAKPYQYQQLSFFSRLMVFFACIIFREFFNRKKNEKFKWMKQHVLVLAFCKDLSWNAFSYCKSFHCALIIMRQDYKYINNKNKSLKKNITQLECWYWHKNWACSPEVKLLLSMNKNANIEVCICVEKNVQCVAQEDWWGHLSYTHSSVRKRIHAAPPNISVGF